MLKDGFCMSRAFYVLLITICKLLLNQNILFDKSRISTVQRIPFDTTCTCERNIKFNQAARIKNAALAIRRRKISMIAEVHSCASAV